MKKNMKVVILNAFDEDNHVTLALKEVLKGNENVDWHDLTNANILPCRGCGYCGVKTPGRCVMKDDFEHIVKSIVKKDIMLFLTPIHFGGYASKLKLLIDRFMVIGTPLYTVKDGDLLHPMRYDMKKLIGIGLGKNNYDEQKEGFENLVTANAWNMLLSHEVVTFCESHQYDEILQGIDAIFKEGVA